MQITVYAARYRGSITLFEDRYAAQAHCAELVAKNRDQHPAGTFRWMDAPEWGDIDNLFIDPGVPGEVLAHHTGAQVWRMPVINTELDQLRQTVETVADRLVADPDTTWAADELHAALALGDTED